MDLWQKGQENCQENPLYVVIFRFFVHILLKIPPLVDYTDQHIIPGVNACSKQPTTAEKWKHNPGIICRARWTLPSPSSDIGGVGCQGRHSPAVGRLVQTGRKRSAPLDTMKERTAAKATASGSSGTLPSVSTAGDTSAF